MQEEQDTCRICSAPAEPDQPLFYPCKCSGTIRYIHQDCLTTWLAHSKKKTCDVCKYPYSFTKVYAQDMPARLPVFLLLRRLAQQGALAMLFAIRAVMVGTIWLAFLPWVTVWTWRVYFATGESTAWWVSNRTQPEFLVNDHLLSANVSSNATDEALLSMDPFNSTLILSLLSHPTVRNISSDIVTGQIIASIIVLGFVAVFLLREWISQNARPGIFDDAEAPPQGEEAQMQQPIRVQLHVPDNVMQPAAAMAVADRDRAPPVEQANGLNNLEPNVTQNGHVSDTDADEHETRVGGGGKKVRRLDTETRPSRKDKGKRVADGNTSTVDSAGPSTSTGIRRRRRSWGDGYSAARESSPMDLKPEQTQFTFRAPVPSPSSFVPGTPPPFFGDPSSSLQLDDGSRAVPSGDSVAPPASPYIFGDATSNHVFDFPEWTPEPSTSDISRQPRRPPMPSISLPPLSGSTAPSPSLSVARSHGHTPLASPSLATYSAPEEFEAGPSNLSGYFQGLQDREQEEKQAENSAMKEEHHRYFREPDEGDGGDGDGEEDVTMDDETIAHAVIPPPPLAPQLSDGEEDYEEEEDDEANMPFGEDLADGDDGDDGDDQPEFANVLQRNGAGDEQQEPLRVEVEPIDQEDIEAAMEDDMDGALEAIGLRGPIFGVLQNAALMIFVLDTTIGIGVWLPFTIGKSIALLSLDPKRFMQVLHLPIRAIRFATDPMVDFVVFLLAKTFVPPMTRALHTALELLTYMLTAVMGREAASHSIDLSAKLFNRTLEAVSVALDQGVTYLVSTTSSATSTPTPSLLERLASSDSPLMHFAEPYFAPLGDTVRVGIQDFKANWVKLAEGSGTSSRIFAVSLGYTLDVLFLALYLNVLTAGTVRSAGRAMRNAVRQQLLVVKVAAFIIVELVVFPLGCGVMLDVCTVYLFPQGSFRSRAAFLMFAPLTATFYHWVLGTMFMYQFAILLAGCRAIMRPGAMWFIKDPQDQNFHPIRDILERPTVVQIRKLLLSALMYGFVVACGVATVSGILRVFSRTIMPFRWKIQEPISSVPIDLLFLHLVLPYTLHYFRPKKMLRTIGVQLWKYLSHQLRLTSYMFGDRHPSEEFTPSRWSWRQLFVMNSDVEMDDAEAVHDGTFKRVPNSDNVALVKEEKATVEVNQDGVPQNAEEARLMLLQNYEAEKAKRNIKDDYIVVYIPPNLKYRVVAFIFALWVVGSVLLAASLAGPVLIGRGFFKLFIPHHVHDGYSFLAGFYLLWGCWIISVAVDRMDKRRQRRGGDEPRAEFPLYFAKRSLLWIGQVTYMVLFLGIIIPTLIALVMELYVIMPIRYTLDPDMEPRIRIVEMWALGLLYTKILLRAQRLPADARIGRGIIHIQRTGWTHLDPIRATRDVIAPLTAGLLGMILFPPLIIHGIRRILHLEMHDSFLLLHLYPTIFTIAGCTHGFALLASLVSSWSQGVRDKEFLVEMRLQNLESELENKEASDVDVEVDPEE